MSQVVLSLVLGGITGVLFAVFGLPVPAPANLAGLMGIVGLFLGYLVGSYLKTKVP